MLGLNGKGYTAMILTQAIIFVLPSIVLAYGCAYPCLYLIFKKFYQEELGEVDVTYFPTTAATIEAISIGLLIPLLSAIVPIQNTLSKTVSESLSFQRAASFFMVQSRDIKVIPYLLFGLICTTFGVAVYIVLP